MTFTVLKVLRFRYSDLKQLLLKAYILTRFGAFLFTFDDHMLIGEQKMKPSIIVHSCVEVGF